MAESDLYFVQEPVGEMANLAYLIGSRATRELGLVYTPIEESLRRTVEWYVAQGLVTRSLPGVPAPA